MATRSFIAKKTIGGYVASYCHNDGYPESVGHILKQYYTNPLKINSLLALGSISSLGKEVGRKHSFEYEKRHPGWTVAYHRDRGDEWETAKHRLYKGIIELTDRAYNYGAEYLYIYEKGRWQGFEIIYPSSAYVLPKLKRVAIP